MRGLDKFFPQCTWTSVRAFLAQRLCDRDGFDGLTLPARPNLSGMQNGCPPTVFGTKSNGFLAVGRNSEGGVERIPIAKRGPTRAYSLLLFCGGFACLPLRPPLLFRDDACCSIVCLFVFQVSTITHSGPLAASTTLGRVIVVVLCSREAVCFACQGWLDSPLKHLHAAPRAPPQSANRQPRGHVVPHTA